MTVQDIYNQTIRPLPASDRLRLASLILNDINVNTVDVSDRWEEEDYRDFAKASWERSPNLTDEGEDAAG